MDLARGLILEPIVVVVSYCCDMNIILFSQGTKCELKVKNGAVYEGVFKTYGPEVRMT